MLSYTNTPISKHGIIKVIFKDKILQDKVDVELAGFSKNYFKVSVLDDYTLQFIPSFELENGKRYTINIPSHFLPHQEKLKFTIDVIKQEVSLKKGVFHNYDEKDPNLLSYSGKIELADSEKIEKVKSLFNAKQGEKAIEIYI